MHISPLILLALGTVALALPTDDTGDVSLLEKRSSRPWLDSFDSDDVTCQDKDGDSADNERPFIEAGDCQNYSPSVFSQRIGGSWGAGKYSITSFSAYEFENCTGTLQKTIPRKGSEDGFCFALDSLNCQNGDSNNPCFWNSVRGNK